MFCIIIIKRLNTQGRMNLVNIERAIITRVTTREIFEKLRVNKASTHCTQYHYRKTERRMYKH